MVEILKPTVLPLNRFCISRPAYLSVDTAEGRCIDHCDQASPKPTRRCLNDLPRSFGVDRSLLKAPSASNCTAWKLVNGCVLADAIFSAKAIYFQPASCKNLFNKK